MTPPASSVVLNEKIQEINIPVTMTGNDGVAEAMRQVDPDVVAAYPITPTTTIMEAFTKFQADGKCHTEVICAESEHSAMSACIGAAAANGGGRVMTATDGPGLAYMNEVLYIASSMRLPIILAIGNRSLSAPLNIHQDHSDTMSVRDAGWIQLYSENNQEAYDNIIQAVRIGEHAKVRLPVMVCFDGFQTTHSVENFYMLSDEHIKDFIGEFKSINPLLDVSHPVTYGATNRPDYYFEFKRQQEFAMEQALDVVQQVGQEYGELTGRYYNLFESYYLDDADYALVALSSTAGTLKDAVDELRDQGIKVGLLKPRVFRPFPSRQIAETLKHLKVVGVLDRVSTCGAFGAPLFNEIRSSLYDYTTRPKIVNYIHGLGGRDLNLTHALNTFQELIHINKQGTEDKLIRYINLRD